MFDGALGYTIHPLLWMLVRAGIHMTYAALALLKVYTVRRNPNTDVKMGS